MYSGGRMACNVGNRCGVCHDCYHGYNGHEGTEAANEYAARAQESEYESNEQSA